MTNQESNLKQVEPLINPDEPTTDSIYRYYLLEPLKSPPIAPENAICWTPYPEPKEFFRTGLPDDYRRAYGDITYERELTWEQLRKFNMLPFDYVESLLYDLWRSFDRDLAITKQYVEQFYNLITGDPGLKRLNLAVSVFHYKWDLEMILAELEERR